MTTMVELCSHNILQKSSVVSASGPWVAMEKFPMHKIPIDKIPMDKIPVGKILMGIFLMGKIPMEKIPMGKIPRANVRTPYVASSTVSSMVTWIIPYVSVPRLGQYCRVIMTMVQVLCSHTILQKSLSVSGSGPCVAM
ncbi:hypothetical protein EYF80_012299 [Liparis tanakae]|uniref:Uncharacterized protein n=1 Tax=Liparis tanakae TaxID=230148 RepID=A0A4Z2IIF5_9TELE|nr:hypothetical protein EYF80_012299 [Liparis tanakae]